MSTLAQIPERNYRIKTKLGNFRAISETLFGLRGEGLWAMLSAYFDESGTHSQSPILVVAGLLAEVRQWEKFVVEWKRILCDVGLPYFHAADFAQGVKPFEQLTKEKKAHLMLRLTNAIKRRVAFRVWTAIVMDDFRQLFRKDELGFGICAFGCASRLKWLAMQKSDSYKIPYTFEHGGRGSDRAFKGFKSLLDGGLYDFYRNSSLTISSRLEAIPLQAADLHSYEVYKYFADQMLSTGRQRRKSLEQLLTIRDAGGYLFALDKLQMYVDSAKKNREAPAEIPVDYLDMKREIKLERINLGVDP